ncbi:MAG: energy transducer TonB [Acidobacteria bacterium]|nr:energy transducer TonB [Acidobacteriota bacterium]
MFDTLVESAGHGRDNARTGMFVFVTSVVYVVALLAIAVGTIIWFNPGLTDALDVTTLVAPPPPPAAPPPAPAQPQVVQKVIDTPTTFTAPVKPPEKIPDPSSVQSRPVVSAVASTGVPGGVPGGVTGGVPGGVPGGASSGPPPPPPPPPPAPTPTPTPVPREIKVSGGVLQGSAIRRVQPPYPPIAKAARAQGAVQVQVTISEDGRVIDAQVVSGHPLLREAALQAARQWAFKPTELSGVPVKVQGVLTFNFTLN